MRTNKNKGITLIALIITIIILLILAGISIQALTNQGLFSQAQNANDTTKMANAREQIMIVLNEWQIEKVTSLTNLEEFFNKKAKENTIDAFEKSDEDGKYNIYKDSYVILIDAEGNIVEDIQKSGSKPNVSNIKITTDGTTEVAENSQLPRRKLQINFDTSIENGTIKSVTPAVPYTTNGTETEVTFTVVGTVNGTDYRKTITVEFAEKYKQIEKLTADKLNVVLSTTENKMLKDEHGNVITVPAKFKIVSDSTTSNAITVDKGIVVEDVTGTATNGSQFVWIPVGTIEKEDNTTVEVNLDRYTFDESGNEKAQGENIIDEYYSETESKGNTIAKSITDFKTSVTKNGGYYIGRYEARKNEKSGKLTEVKTDTTWIKITQLDAATQSRNMYDSTQTFTSDLMNSYAWDTAVLFIQNCTNIKYSRQKSLNPNSPTTPETSKDIQCNIYDMASNILEWSTETGNYPDYPCVYRGGSYNRDKYYTSYRSAYRIGSGELLGFRPILYL